MYRVDVICFCVYKLFVLGGKSFFFTITDKLKSFPLFGIYCIAIEIVACTKHLEEYICFINALAVFNFEMKKERSQKCETD